MWCGVCVCMCVCTAVVWIYVFVLLFDWVGDQHIFSSFSMGGGGGGRGFPAKPLPGESLAHASVFLQHINIVSCQSRSCMPSSEWPLWFQGRDDQQSGDEDVLYPCQLPRSAQQLQACIPWDNLLQAHLLYTLYWTGEAWRQCVNHGMIYWWLIMGWYTVGSVCVMSWFLATVGSVCVMSWFLATVGSVCVMGQFYELL